MEALAKTSPITFQGVKIHLWGVCLGGHFNPWTTQTACDNSLN